MKGDAMPTPRDTLTIHGITFSLDVEPYWAGDRMNPPEGGITGYVFESIDDEDDLFETLPDEILDWGGMEQPGHEGEGLPLVAWPRDLPSHLERLYEFEVMETPIHG